MSCYNSCAIPIPRGPQGAQGFRGPAGSTGPTGSSASTGYAYAFLPLQPPGSPREVFNNEKFFFLSSISSTAVVVLNNGISVKTVEAGTYLIQFNIYIQENLGTRTVIALENDTNNDILQVGTEDAVVNGEISGTRVFTALANETFRVRNRCGGTVKYTSSTFTFQKLA